VGPTPDLTHTVSLPSGTSRPDHKVSRQRISAQSSAINGVVSTSEDASADFLVASGRIAPSLWCWRDLSCLGRLHVRRRHAKVGIHLSLGGSCRSVGLALRSSYHSRRSRREGLVPIEPSFRARLPMRRRGSYLPTIVGCRDDESRRNIVLEAESPPPRIYGCTCWRYFVFGLRVAYTVFAMKYPSRPQWRIKW
jgi:hypothetical protein